MRKILLTFAAMALLNNGMAQDAAAILKKVEANMSSDNRVMTTEMTIRGRRASRTLEAKTWAVGSARSFTEYLAPAAERGTKMLKINDQLWMYSPQADRTVLISGHMLRQSVMGSDLSYEDMMEDRRLTDIYEARLVGNEEINGRKAYVLELTARVSDVAYQRQLMWVDAERFVPLRQEMYARSGTLLRRMETLEVRQIGRRWFPVEMNYRDMLKQGEGTVFKIKEISFDQPIPESVFSRAGLK